MNVALYLRMSDPSQETSIADQRNALRAFCKKHGYRIVAEYVDEGISGDDTASRAGFQRMIAESASGQWQAIVCWDVDRFGRFDSIEAGFWIQPLRKAGVFLETIAQGRIDWTEFAGRIMYSIQAEAKHSYLRDLSRNVNRGMLAAAREGKHLGASPPLGYVIRDGAWQVDEEAAALTREIFRLYLSGVSSTDIARRFNERGIAPPRARQWNNGTVLNLLKNEAVIGIYRWNRTTQAKYSQVRDGEVVPVKGAPHWRKSDDDLVRIPDHHAAIIDDADFARVQDLLRENQKATAPKKWSGPFALRGLVFCGACGAAMHGRRRRYGSCEPFYVCSSSLHSGKCRTNAVHQGYILAEVYRVIFEHYIGGPKAAQFRERLRAGPKNRKRSEQPDSGAVERRLEAVRAKLAKAKQRLVECDADMLTIVQEQVRKLIADESRAASELRALKRRPEDFVRDLDGELARLNDALASLREDADIERGAPPADVRRRLAHLVRRITVYTKERVLGPKRRVFELDRVKVDFPLGAHLPTAARRTSQVCAIGRSRKSS